MRARSVAMLVSAALGASVMAQVPAPQGPPPQFRAEVAYVEVDARVLDAAGQPIRGLTQKDFAVFENGVPQELRTFSVVDLPVPAASRSDPAPERVREDVATNTRTSVRGRTYLIVIDSIGRNRTPLVRKFLRDFIERSIGPDDLVGFATTGRDTAFENFTNDKARLIAAANRVAGQTESPAVAEMMDLSRRAALLGGRNVQDMPVASGSTAAAFTSQRMLTRLVHAMGGAEGGSKAIILVSEGHPFEMVTNTEGVTLITDRERLATAARRGNVPIYPVDPRGLSSGSEEAIEVGLIGPNDHPEASVQTEVRRGQDQLRAIADDSGGVPIVSTNALAGGLDRIVSLSSYYYVLGYSSSNTRLDGKYRKINVTVDRPGARVLSRRGYTAATTGVARGPVLAGPPKSSIELRQALNAVLPTSGIPLVITAAAFRQPNKHASVAVVIETLGSELAWRNDVLAAPLEMTAVALERRGSIKAGDIDRLSLSTRSDTADRVRQFGYRWLARLDDLTPGRYQIRGAASNGPAKQGSVWFDIEIPDFSKAPLAMSDVMMASQAAMLRPTHRPDRRLEDALPGPPTTLRQFPEGGSVAIYAEVYDNQLDRPHDIEASVVVTNEQGEVVFRTTETQTSRQLAASGGVLPLKIGIPLVNIRPGNYTLAVDARQRVNRSISAGRAVPFQVVRPGDR